MFAAHATEMADNPAFRLKLVLLLAAAVNAGVFHRAPFRSVAEWDRTRTRAASRSRGGRAVPRPVDRRHRLRPPPGLPLSDDGAWRREQTGARRKTGSEQ